GQILRGHNVAYECVREIRLVVAHLGSTSPHLHEPDMSPASHLRALPVTYVVKPGSYHHSILVIVGTSRKRLFARESASAIQLDHPLIGECPTVRLLVDRSTQPL